MDPDFWRARWREGRTGFHRNEVHPLLERHAARLPSGARVLVPLAGKTLDMRHLAEKGHGVVGIELVEDAARAFFAEAEERPEEQRVGGCLHLRAGGVELVVGDFFRATPWQLGPIDAVYDRASLVALPPDMRALYAAHLASLLDRDTNVLMVTVEYDQRELSGPPFSVAPSEIEAIFGGPFEIFPLETVDALDASPNLRERGLTRLIEHALWLRRRG
jgi:thiopurine S-methyltransferase